MIIHCKNTFLKKIILIKVEFPIIEDKAYEAIKSLVKIGMNLNIQTDSKIIGKAKLLDYDYIN